MKLLTAIKVLKEHDVKATDYDSLMWVDCNRDDRLYQAVERMKTYFSVGY